MQTPAELPPRRRRHEQALSVLSPAARHRVAVGLCLALVALVVPVLLSLGALMDGAPVRAGAPSPRTVVATASVRVDDPDATELARRQAADAVTDVLVVDPQAQTATIQKVRDAFAAVQAARTPELVQPPVDDQEERESAGDGEPAAAVEPVERVPTSAEQQQALASVLTALDADGIELLVALGDAELASLRAETVAIAQEIARRPMSADEVASVSSARLATEIALRSFSTELAGLVVEPLMLSAVRPTMVVDEEASRQAREDAVASVAAVERSYPAGTPIVTAGEHVDEVAYAALQQLGQEGSDPLLTLLSRFTLTAVLLVVAALWLRVQRPDVLKRPSRVLLLAVLPVLYAAAYLPVRLLAVGYGNRWMLLLPVAGLVLIAAVLFDAQVALVAAVTLTAVTALAADARAASFVLVTSLAASALASARTSRSGMRRSVLVLAAVHVAAAVGVGLAYGSVADVPSMALVGLAAGLVAVVVVQGLLPFLESAFNVLTASVLLELTDRNHPLLRRLEQEALGTYNHSVVVSSMVERAARDIGADGLLASAQALYHDIGKVVNPTFFVENQFSGVNPHDELTPRLSAQIIIRHVADGMQVATSYRLPVEVVDGISTHHGTTLVAYFHSRAVAEEGDAAVDPGDFRYPHRKPWTKEAALLLLADCCESATRATAAADRSITRETIEALVHRLVDGRLTDGELDDSPLTMADLQAVKRSFVETLVGVYHPRVAYPPKPAAAAA